MPTLTKQGSRRLAAQYAQGDRGIIYGEDEAGNVWTTDGYSAVKAKLEPNTPKAKVEPNHPKMDMILNGLTNFEPITSELENDTDLYYATVTLNDKVKVNADYLARVKQALPKAVPYVTGEFELVAFKEHDEIVALLMPLRR